MAHTITERAHGAVDCKEDRLSLPASSRASMYFILPARPAAIHASKWRNSLKSWTAAVPASSKPALRAASFTRAVMWLSWDNGTYRNHYPSLAGSINMRRMVWCLHEQRRHPGRVPARPGLVRSSGLSLTRVQLVEGALQLFQLLPSLAELAFRR